ncbi:MAG: hypothetical protein GF411_08005 [Candidatus Lokiarchaeota archaeon]|nr:hypothetical protein [Candidatus Lokiarchaeota archaeon]
MLKAATLCRTADSIPCKRESCITLYTSQNCLFCELVVKKVEEILKQFGLSPYMIRKVRLDELNSEELSRITLLPTTQICDTELHGIPSDATITDAVTRSVFKPCFAA